MIDALDLSLREWDSSGEVLVDLASYDHVDWCPMWVTRCEYDHNTWLHLRPADASRGGWAVACSPERSADARQNTLARSEDIRWRAPQQCTGIVHTNLGKCREGDSLPEEVAHLELANRPRALAQDVAFATVGKRCAHSSQRNRLATGREVGEACPPASTTGFGFLRDGSRAILYSAVGRRWLVRSFQGS